MSFPLKLIILFTSKTRKQLTILLIIHNKKIVFLLRAGIIVDLFYAWGRGESDYSKYNTVAF